MGRVLLTGGSSGIGAAIAGGLSEAGYHVAVIARRPPEHWEDAAVAQACEWIPGDLAGGSRGLAALRAWVTRQDIALDGLFNCAASYGFGPRHPFMGTTLAEWTSVFRVNVHGAFSLLRLVVPIMIKARRGIIVNVSSDAATVPQPGRSAYSSSKAAAHLLFATLALELQEYGVSVVQILPSGPVDTPGVRRRRPPDFDFSGYLDASIFRAPALGLLRTMGAGQAGSTIVVGAGQ
jgi:NAD(P)-dependent dehydrogenase (short-subunit alcohol dehydrogenase family)